MASRTLEIQVNQTGSARAGLDGLTGGLDKLNASAGKANTSTTGLTGGLRNLASSYGPALGIAGVAAAIGSYAQQSSAAAMQSGRLETATDSLGARFGLTGNQIVASMKAASLGAISGAEAMEKANLAMSLGVIKTAEDFKTLTEGAAVLGRAVGLDATQALDSLVIGLGRGSTEVLDNLGITLKAAEAQETYAARLGKTVSELTEVEKKEAFQAVALEKIREKTAELGGLQEDQLSKLERSSAAWADLQVKSGEVINTFVAATGILDGLNTTMDYMLENVTAVSGAFENGLGAGLLQVFDNANPVTQLLERFGVDVIPDFVAASGEAAAAIQTQAEAHTNAAGAAAEQASAMSNLSLLQMDTISDLSKLDEAYNEKKQDLLDNRLKAESDASESQAENYRTMNEKLNEIDLNRGTQTAEQIAQKKAKVIAGYNEENAEIVARLNERQAAIDEQIAKEKAQHEEKAAEIKRLMALQVLEQSGQLEELTGIAGITAQQYMDAVAAGAISANKEVETQAAATEKTFEGSQKRASEIVKQNQDLIKRLHGETTDAITRGSKTSTDSVVSDFDRQANAARRAYDARSLTTGTVTANTYRRNTDWGPGMATGGFIKVPPGYPNDTYPIRVSSGELVSVIPANEAGRGPGFAQGTGGIPAGWKLDENGDYVPPEYQPGYIWNGKKWVPPAGGTVVRGNKGTTNYTGFGGWTAATRASAYQQAMRNAGVSRTSTTPRNDSGLSSKERQMARLAARAAESAPATFSPAPSSTGGSTSRGSLGGGGFGGPVSIHIDYHPTVSLANQFELVQALEPAFQELARKYGIPTNG